MKDSHNMCTYCTWNGSCVGSDIGMGSWSVSIPTQALKVVYRQAECRRWHKFCYCVETPIG